MTVAKDWWEPLLARASGALVSFLFLYTMLEMGITFIWSKSWQSSYDKDTSRREDSIFLSTYVAIRQMQQAAQSQFLIRQMVQREASQKFPKKVKPFSTKYPRRFPHLPQDPRAQQVYLQVEAARETGRRLDYLVGQPRCRNPHGHLVLVNMDAYPVS
jgi:hypothetical protein